MRRTWIAAVVTGALVTAAVLARPRTLVGLVVVAAVSVPLELAFALHPGTPFRPGWRTDVVHFLVNSVLTAAGVVVVVVLVGLPARAFTPDLVRDAFGGLPGALQFAVALFVAELAAYWAHRAAHEVPALWRFHKVHHASPRLDWLAAAHLHPVDQVWTRGCAVDAATAIPAARRARR